MTLAKNPDALDAAHAGQPDVYQRHPRRVVADALERRLH
jgi:hypothetical protein